jgi:hypothetical protein
LTPLDLKNRFSLPDGALKKINHFEDGLLQQRAR